MMMEEHEVTGASASRPGSRASTEPEGGLGRSGFDPSRGDLWPFLGYAPGSYIGKCRDCGETFIDLDKRARQCLGCAIIEAKAELQRLRTVEAERDAYRTQAINRGWNWRLCDAYGRDEYERQLEREVDRTLEVMLGRKTLAESFRDSSPKGGDACGSVACDDSAGPKDIAHPSPHKD